MHKARFYYRTVPLRVSLLPLLTGILAGLINGLLGAGGGVIVILVLGALVRISGGESVSRPALGEGYPTGDRPGAAQESDIGRDIPAASLMAMLPVSVLSAAQYAAAGRLELASFAPLLLPAVIGGVLGGIALDRVRLPLLERLFALILVISGGRMLLG